MQIGGEVSLKHATELYEELMSRGIEVLFDDRDERPGTKFADAELMGISYRITVSDRLLETGEYEFTEKNERNKAVDT